MVGLRTPTTRAGTRGLAMDIRVDIGSRRLVLVDIENVVGGLACDEAAAQDARCSIVGGIGVHPMNQVVVATCHKGYPHVAWTWPSARRLVRSGADGADLELLDVLTEDVSHHFQHVVLVSGDGIFTDRVTELGARGVKVTVAARSGHLSNRLRLAAAHVVYLDGAWVSSAGRAGKMSVWALVSRLVACASSPFFFPGCHRRGGRDERWGLVSRLVACAPRTSSTSGGSVAAVAGAAGSIAMLHFGHTFVAGGLALRLREQTLRAWASARHGHRLPADPRPRPAVALEPRLRGVVLLCIGSSMGAAPVAVRTASYPSPTMPVSLRTTSDVRGGMPSLTVRSATSLRTPGIQFLTA